MTSNDPSSANNGDPEDAEKSPRSLKKTSSRQRRAFQAAAQAAEHRGSPQTGPSASEGIETGNLEKWATDSGKIVPSKRFNSLRVASDHTSEHKVFHDKERDRALKHT